MFSNDIDFDIDEDFLKDVFKSADEQAVLKRSSPQPQETVPKKLRVGDFVPHSIPAEEPRVVVSVLSPVEAPSRSRTLQASDTAPLQRKFPGPAGLLPDRGGCLNRTLEAQYDSEDDSEMPTQELCSQPARSVFQSEAWLQAQRDLGLVGPAKSALAVCTLRWARGKALAGQLPNLRVPFLLVALRNIDFSLQDPFVLVHDPTGQMTGTLHREVREAHETRLRPGTVLVLRQVGVLTTRRTLRNHYLNITANNVVSIYHAPDQQQLPSVVEVIRVQEISLLEVAQNIRDIQERRPTIDLPAAHLLDGHDEQLFSTVGSSVVARSHLAGHPGAPPSRLHARNSVSHVQHTFYTDKQGTSNCAVVNVPGGALDRTPSPVSKFPVTHNSNIRPHHVPLSNGMSKVVSSSAGTGSTSDVAPSLSIQNCGFPGAQGRLLGHEQTNMLPDNGAVPRNLVSTRGFGFKPKTSQLSNIGSPHVANGNPLGGSSLLPRDQGTVKGMQCSLNTVNLDEERRIVENVLDSIDPSQLFDEDF